mmetsp:Transcript_36147/g.77083  ORF Transcript_36147/g.77083 Transcript_36147/m.77083 type:complete len:88 (+) Transcript_36147:2024-2287(+)
MSTLYSGFLGRPEPRGRATSVPCPIATYSKGKALEINVTVNMAHIKISKNFEVDIFNFYLIRYKISRSICLVEQPPTLWKMGLLTRS